MCDFPVHDWNKAVGHTFFHRSTMQIAISVKRDRDVTSHVSSLLAWLCVRTSRRYVEL